MQFVEPRVSFLEGRMVKLTATIRGIQDVLLSLDRRVSRLEDAVLRLDEKIDRRVDGLDRKLDQQFAWLIGLQVSTFLGYLATVVALLKR